MIDGDAPQASLPQLVDAAVAGVRHDRPGAAVALDEVRRHASGPHVLAGSVGFGSLEDALVDQLDGGDQPVLVVALLPVLLEGPGGLGVPAGQLEELAHLLHRDAAGHFAGRVAAHSVEHREEAFRREREEAVLVVVPLHPDVGPGGVQDAHGALDRSPRVDDCASRREAAGSGLTDAAGIGYGAGMAVTPAVMVTVKGEKGYAQAIRAAGHAWTSDEPTARDGSWEASRSAALCSPARKGGRGSSGRSDWRRRSRTSRRRSSPRSPTGRRSPNW